VVKSSTLNFTLRNRLEVNLFIQIKKPHEFFS
jgi:hypothetical protein